MSFKFVKVETKISFKEAMDLARSFFPIDYSVDLELLSEDRGRLVGFFLTCTLFEEDGEFINFLFSDRSVRVNVFDVNIFCYLYEDNMGYGIFSARYPAAICTMGNFTWKNCLIHKRRREDGQSKIFLSTLVPLLESGPELHLLVIGSSSEDTFKAGQSYQALIDYLSIAGYYGTMVLYDPFDQERVVHVDGFEIHFRAEYFDYSKRILSPHDKPFSHVFDDVWKPTYTKPVHAPITYAGVRVDLKEGTSKFAYKLDGNTLVLKNGLVNHSDIGEGLGGGMVTVIGNHVIVFGTSNRLGPYDEALVSAVLAGYCVIFRKNVYRLGRETWDPHGGLYQNYSDARISTKYYGEGRPKLSWIKDQCFYTGLEKRLLYNVPHYSTVECYGCGCVNCNEYGLIFKRMRVYSEIHRHDWIKGLLTRVISDKCLKFSGSTANKVIGVVLSAAHKNISYVELKEAVCKRGKIGEVMFNRVFDYLVRIRKIDVHRFMDAQFVERHEIGNKTVWFPKGRRDIYQVYVGSVMKIFTMGGKEVTDVYRDGKLVYRPRSKDASRDAAVRFFLQHYGYLFNSFEGVGYSNCSGTRSCGFGSSFHYRVVKGSKSSAVAISNGWSLINTSISDMEMW